MNAKLSSPSLLLTALLCLGLGSVQAQDPSVPSYINYQGSVTDSNGLPLGATNATPPLAAPINRKVLFRIYDSATGPTNLLWTEEQTVTISLGQFSVLLGRGIQFGSEDHGSIESVFTSNDGGGPEGPQRFLGITVDNGDNDLDDNDVAISPRQQITTAAYSFRAGTADSVASGSSLVLNNSADNGLGYFGTGRTFNSTEINGPVLYGLSGGALGSVTGATQKTALRWNDNSQVGIGTSTLSNAAAGTKLVVQGDDASYPPAQLSIRGNSDTVKRLLMGYNTTFNYGMISSYNGSTPSLLYLNNTGGDIRLGNPTSSTTAVGGLRSALGYGLNDGYSFDGDTDTGMYRTSTNQLSFYTGNQNRMVINSAGQLFPIHGVFAPVAYGSSNGYSFNGDADTGMYRPTTNQLSFHSAGVERMRINSSGRVGIGTASPSADLHVERSNSEIASIYATGPPTGGQGSGVVYVGQSLQFGGGMSYDGDGTPELVGDTDRITFSRRDNSVDEEVFSYGVHTSDVRFNGKVGIGTPAPTATLEVVGGSVTSGGIISAGPKSGSHIAIDGDDIQRYFGTTADTLHLNFYGGNVSIGSHSATTTIKGTFNNSSDRNLKEDFSPVDGQAVLDRLLHLPISTWKFKDNEGRRHIGPVAQDFHDAFDGLLDLHSDDKTIAPLDEAGIAFVSIQELARQHQVKDAEIKKLQEENASLRASFAEQERQISAQNARDNSLEAKLAAIEKTLSALKPGKRTASLSKSRAAE